MTTTPPADWREHVEAAIRQLMARHAAYPDRGYDTARQRAAWRREIDDLLDQLATGPKVVYVEPVAYNPGVDCTGCDTGTDRVDNHGYLICLTCDTPGLPSFGYDGLGNE